MTTIIRFVLLTALRDRLFLALIAILVASVGVSSVLANTAMIEQHEATLVFSATVARLLLALGLSVFICFHVRYAFDSKEIDVMLSRPISRPRLLLAYFLGFALVGAVLIAVNVAVIALLRPNSNLGLLAWAISLSAEAAIIAAVALFASISLRSAVTSVMACLVIYVVGRMMGFFLATIQSHLLFKEAWLNWLSKTTIEFCSALTPRLDLFAKSEWLIYPPVRIDWLLFGAQTAVIVPLLLLLAMIDFARRQF